MARKGPCEHRIPIATLIQFADSVEIFVERDAEQFATRMIGPADVTAMVEARDALAETFDDDYYVSFASVEQDKVVDARARAADQVRVIRNMAEIALEGDGRYAAFGFDKMASAADAEYHHMLRRVHRVGLRFLPQLAPQGLTTALLDALAATTTEMDEALELYAVAVENRIVATAERIALSNALYRHVNRLAASGEACFSLPARRCKTTICCLPEVSFRFSTAFTKLLWTSL